MPRRFNQAPAPKKVLPPMNDAIKASEVRVILDSGEQLGVLPIAEANKKAVELGLDLVEVSPQANPPVCKIIDFGKYQYQKERKAKEAKKNQKIVELKEVKFSPKIDVHDFEYRVKNIMRFIDKGDKVKVSIRFRGRELAHTEMGFEVIRKVLDALKDQVNVEKPAKLEGRVITAILTPLKSLKTQK